MGATVEAANGTACYALSDNWLETTRTDGGAIGTTTTTFSGWWPNYYWYVAPDPRPITLKFSEIEFLRGKAAKDKKLRAILQKFTPLIQIEVDF